MSTTVGAWMSFWRGWARLMGTLEPGSMADWTAGLVAFVALLIATTTQLIQTVDRRNADAQGLRVSTIEATAENHGRTVVATAVKILNEEGRAKSSVKVYATAGSANPIEFPFMYKPQPALGDFGARKKERTDRAGGTMSLTFDILTRNEKVSAIFYTLGFSDRQILVFFTDFRGKRWMLDSETGRLKKAKLADEPQSSINDLFETV